MNSENRQLLMKITRKIWLSKMTMMMNSVENAPERSKMASDAKAVKGLFTVGVVLV